MKKTKILLISFCAFFIAAAWVVFMLKFLSGPEDTWICQEGEWVKHGVPRAPKPAEPCQR